MKRGRDLVFPDRVIEYFEGRIGQPPIGFSEPLRQFVLKDRVPLEGRPGADLPAVESGRRAVLDRLFVPFGSTPRFERDRTATSRRATSRSAE